MDSAESRSRECEKRRRKNGKESESAEVGEGSHRHIHVQGAVPASSSLLPVLILSRRSKVRKAGLTKKRDPRDRQAFVRRSLSLGFGSTRDHGIPLAKRRLLLLASLSRSLPAANAFKNYLYYVYNSVENRETPGVSIKVSRMESLWSWTGLKALHML